MTETPDPWNGRHPSVLHFESLFRYKHLPPELQPTSRLFQELAQNLLMACNDGPELSAALRKLLESKDCAVRQVVHDSGW